MESWHSDGGKVGIEVSHRKGPCRGNTVNLTWVSKEVRTQRCWKHSSRITQVLWLKDITLESWRDERWAVRRRGAWSQKL